MDETAYAKLNLALHVRGREPDGYHRLETIFAFTEHGDRLSVAPSEDIGLEVTGPFADAIGPAGDNLVTRAARALRERFAVKAGARIKLDKRLPVASGIGGGSADAAAALRLLSRFWRLAPNPETLHEIAATLGADVPACLASRTAFGKGKGDQLYPVETPLRGAPVLLVNPRVAVPTGPVFRAWEGADGGPLGRAATLDGLRVARNDLEPPARLTAPVIGKVLEALQAQTGVQLARMSGSGATCFAIFGSEGERDQAAAELADTGWWCLATRLR
jgi:4-diphosphocytidyl-2-C-methyl-D-erythritol kinase